MAKDVQADRRQLHFCGDRLKGKQRGLAVTLALMIWIDAYVVDMA